MQKSAAAEQFLAAHHMDAAHHPAAPLIASFLDEMRSGLGGAPRSMRMLPTYLTAEGALPYDRPAVVLDLGGTNLRAARVTLRRGCAPTVEGLRVCPAPGSVQPVEWPDFIVALADAIAPLLRRGAAEAIGVCFSYPAEITPQRDGRVLHMTKQVQVNGSQGQLLCAALSKALCARGFAPCRFVLLNDTVAALLGGVAALPAERYSGFYSLIYGTGVNTCCGVATPRILPPPAGYTAAEMLINHEAGGFCGLMAGDFDYQLDAASNDPGDSRYEKMVASRYFGELARLTLAGAALEGLLPRGFAGGIGALDGRQIDAFIDRPQGESLPAQLCHDENDRQILYTLLWGLTARAARLVCGNLTAMLLLAERPATAECPACIVAEGSTFYKSRLFRPLLEQELAKHAVQSHGLHYAFVQLENANLLGAAAAVLLNG